MCLFIDNLYWENLFLYIRQPNPQKTPNREEPYPAKVLKQCIDTHQYGDRPSVLFFPENYSIKLSIHTRTLIPPVLTNIHIFICAQSGHLIPHKVNQLRICPRTLYFFGKRQRENTFHFGDTAVLTSKSWMFNFIESN